MIGELIGSLIQGGTNLYAQQKQMDFEKQMSNTAIQRQIADAQKAGISPSLVLNGGASTPMGASASISQPDLGGVEKGIFELIKQDRQLDAMERLQSEKINAYDRQQNERLEAKQQLQNERLKQNKSLTKMKMKMSNTATKKSNFLQHNYTKKELNSLYDDIDKIKFI